MENDIKSFEPFWDVWYIKDIIGEGGFGKVYSIERNDFGNTYTAALKHLRVPQSQSEVKSIMADGMDRESAERYFEKFAESIVEEFVLMSKLKGNSHIVSYEDHKVVKNPNKIEWDIFIRMEKLTGLIDYISQNKISKKDVIKLGIDICKALELCQKYNIIHRDIKPENIFVSDNGDFKLGDFGIARQIEKTTAGLSKKGTYTYIAPEVYKGEPYGSTVDIYSLGIVMYRFLNNNRVPFMPEYPKIISHEDREAALVERMRGTKLPKPINAEGRLAEIVLKACSYESEKRYENPRLMRKALEAILYNEEEAAVIYPNGDQAEIKSINYISAETKSNTFTQGKSSAEEDATQIMSEKTIINDISIKEEKKEGMDKIFYMKRKAIFKISLLIVLGIIISIIGYIVFSAYNKANEVVESKYIETEEFNVEITEETTVTSTTEEATETVTETETEVLTESIVVSTEEPKAEDSNNAREVERSDVKNNTVSENGNATNAVSNKSSSNNSKPKEKKINEEAPKAEKQKEPVKEKPVTVEDKSLEEKIKAERAAIENSLDRGGSFQGNTPD